MTTLLIAEHDNNTLADANKKAMDAATKIGEDIHILVAGKDCADIADNAYIRFASPKGMFRLVSSEASWSADKTSLYGISISCIEVV